MWLREELLARAAALGVEGRCWGSRGPEAVAGIEARLGLRLPPGVREFALEAGNLQVAPFEILVTGNWGDPAEYSCATETEKLRRWRPEAPANLVQVMGCAGVIWCVSPAGTVASYDQFYVTAGQELQSWPEFGALVDWVFEEAASMR